MLISLTHINVNEQNILLENEQNKYWALLKNV